MLPSVGPSWFKAGFQLRRRLQHQFRSPLYRFVVAASHVAIGIMEAIHRCTEHWWTKRRRPPRKAYKLCAGSASTFRHRPYRLRKLPRHLLSRSNVRLAAIAFTAIAAQSTATSPTQARMAHFDTDSYPIKVDNCCTRSISSYIGDFINPPVLLRTRRVKGVQGYVSGPIYQGTLRWHILDDTGQSHSIVLPESYYVPNSNIRLLSPQHWAQTANDNTPHPNGTWCATYASNVVLQWGQRRYTKTIPIDRHGANIATLHSAPGFKRFSAFCSEIGEFTEDDAIAFSSVMDEVESDNEDEDTFTLPPNPMQTSEGDDFALNGPPMTPPPYEPSDNVAAEFLHWHYALGHVASNKIRAMAKAGILPSRLATCKLPACKACMFAKATRRPWRNKRPPNKIQAGQSLKPGQCVSVDQLESATPGFVAQTKGKLTKARYRVATVFVDHASRFGYVHLQQSTTAEETLQAKRSFEGMAQQVGVKITHYHTDNGRFADKVFMNAVQESGQTISYSGVDAHHQNGIAERRIREIQDQARAMLLHAKHRWPTAIDVALWPYALLQANEIQNATPSSKLDSNGRTPAELFSSTKIAPNLNEWKPFGCPAYVWKDPKKAVGGSRKWDARARLGMYLGKSPKHARSVALILDTSSGLVSPQFHARFDTRFESVQQTPDQAASPVSWKRAAGLEEQRAWRESGAHRRNSLETGTSLSSQPTEPTAEPDPPVETAAEEASEETATDSFTPEFEREIDPNLPRHARSSRGRSRYEREDIWATPAIMDLSNEVTASFPEIGPEVMAMAASADPDTMYFHEAMVQSDRAQFLAAAEKEIAAHSKNNWEVVHKSTVPTGMQVLPAVWSMKRKRRIKSGEVYKWKARLNIDGSKQTKGVNYWETFAPVATWPSIRLIILLALQQGWKTKQIDFVLAYTQAEVECDMYMKIPKGFEVEDGSNDYVIKLKRNLFGQKQAGTVWNKHLVSKLKQVGFKQSAIDECVFYRGKAIYVLYTDDSILTGPDEQELDTIVEDMKATGLELTIDGDVSDFLGVHIERQDDGTIIMSQPHLIDQVLKMLRLDGDSTIAKDTPMASSKLLSRHEDSTKFDGHFNYRSVIGKLNYLEKSTRPDISYAVHQCARFSADPKKEHGDAIKWLGRYLKGTRDRGIILNPNKEGFECFVDADFSGNWDSKVASSDADTARSRTGYVVKFNGCPILWASKLQTEISLSSTEAEYVALSQSMRDVLPMIALAEEMKEKGVPIKITQPTVKCTVFEDNSGAVELAKVPKMRPRTKHINVKYHHFRQHVENGVIKVTQIDTRDQQADVLTKPLEVQSLQRHRLSICGW